jgi:nitrogen fixation protein NifU and related proteins
MVTAWEKFQEQMRSEMEKTYSQTAIEYMMNPRNLGHIHDSNVYASVSGVCGDNMEMWLKIQDEKVENASFCTSGCGVTIACGGMVTELAKGKTLGEALAIGADIIVKKLDGLPDDHIHCAGLASLNLKKAIITYINRPKRTRNKVHKKETEEKP